MAEESIEIWWLEMSKNGTNVAQLLKCFTMVEDNFEICSLEMPQNNLNFDLINKVLHHGWRKCWNLFTWNAKK